MNAKNTNMNDGANKVPEAANRPSRMRNLVLPALAIVVIAVLLFVYFRSSFSSQKSNVPTSSGLQNATTIQNTSSNQPAYLGNTIFNSTSSSAVPPSLP